MLPTSRAVGDPTLVVLVGGGFKVVGGGVKAALMLCAIVALALTSERTARLSQFMRKFETKTLDARTWPAFARLVEANNGVWGGCWCMWYHAKDDSADASPASRRKAKECLVREGQAHASLVFDGKDCVGWCQFGSPQELPRIHNERAYLKANPALPDWRITCFFSGKGYRGNGVAAVALKGAVEQIKKLGGGRIEGYPEDTEGRKASPAFLFNGALSTFERLGFKRSRLIGKHKWVVTRTVR